MDSAPINYDFLLEQYKNSKKALAETDDSIRRVYGRDPFDPAKNGGPGPSRFRRHSPPSSIKMYARKQSYKKRCQQKILIDHESDHTPEPDEDETQHKPSLSSAVVFLAKRRSRSSAIQEQISNSKVTARNRRIFGTLIMGTLQKFQHEEQKRQFKESKRVEIEKKVDAATEQERTRIKKEKEQLILKRQEMKSQVRCYEKQLERADSYDVYEQAYKRILKSSCIRTKSEPRIFFKPVCETAIIQKCLDDSKTELTEHLNEKNDAYKADLDEIQESYKKESFSKTEEESTCLNEEVLSEDVPQQESESESLVVEQEEPMEVDEDSIDDRLFGGSLDDQEFVPIYD